MVERPNTQEEHDDVVKASAKTYFKMEEEGCKVFINPDGEKNYGWPKKDLYPDVIVWKPESPGANSGEAVIIEEIETDESVDSDEAEQWKNYAELGVETFRLIVPEDEVDSAREIIEEEEIEIDELWSYYYDEDGRTKFREEEL